MIRSPRAFGASSFATHVVLIPNDGIRRTGKARVRVRISREEYNNRRLSTKEERHG